VNTVAKIFSLLLRVADAVFILHTSIQKILATNKKLWCIFIDYERAFDTVNLDALWTKRIRTGLRCKMVNMIKAIYVKVQSCVKLSYNNTVPISDFSK